MVVMQKGQLFSFRRRCNDEIRNLPALQPSGRQGTLNATSTRIVLREYVDSGKRPQRTVKIVPLTCISGRKTDLQVRIRTAR